MIDDGEAPDEVKRIERTKLDALLGLCEMGLRQQAGELKCMRRINDLAGPRSAAWEDGVKPGVKPPAHGGGMRPAVTDGYYTLATVR
jgi:hypothetical protein